MQEFPLDNNDIVLHEEARWCQEDLRFARLVELLGAARREYGKTIPGEVLEQIGQKAGYRPVDEESSSR